MIAKGITGIEGILTISYLILCQGWAIPTAYICYKKTVATHNHLIMLQNSESLFNP